MLLQWQAPTTGASRGPSWGAGGQQGPDLKQLQVWGVGWGQGHHPPTFLQLSSLSPSLLPLWSFCPSLHLTPVRLGVGGSLLPLQVFPVFGVGSWEAWAQPGDTAGAQAEKH